MSAPLFVVGHRKPDTDSSTSAVAYARFLNTSGRYQENAIPVVPGELTPQAEWVFKYANVDVPERVETLAPRVRDVARLSPDFLKNSDRLRDAVDMLIRTGHSMLPIVDEQHRLCGVFSNREDAGRYLLNLDAAPIAASLLTWDDLIKLPGGRLVGTTVGGSEYGNIVLALAGDDDWGRSLTADDILIAASLDVLDLLPLERRPSRIILVNAEFDPYLHTNAMARNVSVIVFSGTATDLLSSLNRQVRLESLHFPHGICVGADDLLEDVVGLISSCRRAIPVVDDENRLIGVVARKDLKAPSRRKAILIDHFESDQAVPGIESLDIVEIVDHHRIGNIETPSPVRVDCRPIGSSCSIVAMNYFEANLEPDPSTAILLLGGLCADTLALRGPTATPLDQMIAGRLAGIAGIDLEYFGRDLLRAGDDLMASAAADIWNRDQKVFGVRNRKFAVAQLETVAMDALSMDQLQSLRDELQRDFDRNNYLTSLLVVTDVVKGDSWITCFESDVAEGTTSMAFGGECPCPHWVGVANVVSRKKQIVPELMKLFAELPL